MENYVIGQTQYTRHFSGLYFDARTPEAVRDTIARLRGTGERVRVFYGDTKTGEAWPEEWDILGTIGASMGPCKIPLLIRNARSMGGGALLSASIVAIYSTQSRRAIYHHAAFSPGVWETCAPVSPGYIEAVSHNGKLHAQLKKPGAAARYIAFMRGERFAK